MRMIHVVSSIRLQEIEAEFDKHVNIKDIASQQLDIDPDSIVYIYNYWKLKRRVSHRQYINLQIQKYCIRDAICITCVIF